MRAEQNSSGEELQSEQSKDLTELRKEIQLSNVQLLELTYNEDKFIEHINNLNSKGISFLNNEDHKVAMVYFNETERILQYAASCGKTIDRSAIVAILHNQACGNQKLWDLEKSANYLQAIIYNIQYYFENTNNKADQFVNQMQKKQEQLDQFAAYIHKKQIFALYHLQYCAVNSQIRKHTISSNSARSAIKIMKEVCRLSHLLSQNVIYNNLQQINQARKNSQMIKQLSQLKQELEVRDYEKYFRVVRTLMNSGSHIQGEQQHKNIRNFSIGKLMQLTPLQISQIQSKQSAQNWLKTENIINIALYFGVCYFTVGTQLRFISSQRNQDRNQVYKLSQDFLRSQVYHIYAIMVVMNYVPVRSIFLNHLLSSFNNHYEVDLQKAVVPKIVQENKNDKNVEIININQIQSVQINQMETKDQNIYHEHLTKVNSSQQFITQNIELKQKLKQNYSSNEVQQNKQSQQSKRLSDKNKFLQVGQQIQKSYLIMNSEPNEPNVKQSRGKNKQSKIRTQKIHSITLKQKKSVSPSKDKKQKQKTIKTINVLNNAFKKSPKQDQTKNIKNKSSKSKSKQKKKSLNHTKKTLQKGCIYTTKNKIDNHKSNSNKKSPKKKQSSKSLQKSVRNHQQNNFKSQGLLKKSISKQSLTRHNFNMEDNRLKSLQNKIKLRDTKSSSKEKKGKYKMNKALPTKYTKQHKQNK